MQKVKMDYWDTPQTASRVDMIFGGRMKDLLPEYSIIPDEFKRRGTKWNKIQNMWFFRGFPADTKFIEKKHIIQEDALRHLNAIQRSFDPKHEHKEAAVAWLMSLWFDDIVIPEEKK